MSNPIRLEDLAARLDEINDMIEDLALEREAILNLMKVLRKGQPVREATHDVPDAGEVEPPKDAWPTPAEAIKLALKEKPGEFTRKSLVDHLEDKVASEADNVRNVLYTQLRRDANAGNIWMDERERLYLSTHPKAQGASENGTRPDADQDKSPAPVEADAGDEDEQEASTPSQ